MAPSSIAVQAPVAVVTGAGSGIGKELITQLALQGYAIAAADINEAELANVADQVREIGSQTVNSYSLDVADESAFNLFAEQVQKDFGRVDLVINNAGITRVGEFMHTRSEAFKKVMDVNFWGVVYGSRAFLPSLLKTQGTLVNISSLFGIIGVPGQSSYCASKFAVRGFTEALRQELKSTGVHVACVHPGGIRTNIARSAELDQKDLDHAKIVQALEEKALKMPASKAASIILKGAQRRSKRILIGNDARLIDLFQRLFPSAYDILLKMFGGGALVDPPKV
ncbi:SDR family NAD(P)-dependent oxidoreductase [Maricurvus nonylphenolicus]|uniref:SDR family oxidoreductase n=1 Tax=Maricurvus nonylphenolicus TaxID=1008307 RepID=UPI0036F2F514